MSEPDKTNARRQESKPADSQGFIKEEYAPPKRFPRGRKILRTVLIVLALAVLFGVIAGVSYRISDQVMNRVLESKNEVDVTPADSGNGIDDSGNHAAFNGETLENYDKLLSGVREAAEALSGSVCTVLSCNTIKDEVFDSESVVSAEHCGIVLADNGVEYLIETSYAKLTENKPDSYAVTFSNGTTADAELSGYDEELDLAVLSVDYKDMKDAEKSGITTISIGDGSAVTAGSMAIALGAPNGHIGSIDFGMVTNVDAACYTVDGAVSLLRTNMVGYDDAEGMLVNAKGQLVGIISHVFSEDGDSLAAVSVSDLSGILESLLNDTPRISFGVKLEDLNAASLNRLGIEAGVLVTEVVEDSVAFSNEFRKGDVILSLGDESITGVSTFETVLQSFVDGQKVDVTYLRNGKETTKTVTMKEKE